MIRVERGQEVRPGIFEYRVIHVGREIGGCSRQPLLDACRKIRAIDMGVAGAEIVGLFRKGKLEPDVSCQLEWGAMHTITERDRDGLRVEKYRLFDGAS